MSSMINGVDKFYLVFHRGNATHFEGFESEEAMAENLLYRARVMSGESTEERIEAVDRLAKRVIESIKQDDELPVDSEPDQYDIEDDEPL